MTITEANAVYRVLDFVAGDIDHCDEGTRAKVAEDLAWLQKRAHDALHAGAVESDGVWDERLTLITFEEA